MVPNFSSHRESSRLAGNVRESISGSLDISREGLEKIKCLASLFIGYIWCSARGYSFSDTNTRSHPGYVCVWCSGYSQLYSKSKQADGPVQVSSSEGTELFVHYWLQLRLTFTDCISWSTCGQKLDLNGKIKLVRCELRILKSTITDFQICILQ